MRTILSSSVVLLMALIMSACSGTTDTTPADTSSSVSSTEKGASVQTAEVEHKERSLTTTLKASDYDCLDENLRINLTFKIKTITRERGDGTKDKTELFVYNGTTYDDEGNKYEYRGTFSSSRPTASEECPYTWTQIRNIHVLTPGGQNNLVIKVRFITTTTCDGEREIRVEMDEATCQ